MDTWCNHHTQHDGTRFPDHAHTATAWPLLLMTPVVPCALQLILHDALLRRERRRGGGRGSPLILVLLVYLLLALAAAVWAWRVPEKARRPPCVVFALWIFFGILV